jgi:hypothetical protein
MRCCAGCFGDRGLRKDIFPFRSVETGNCSYCISNNVALLPPADLADYFQLLISAYRPDPEGKLLVQWFRDDWGLFEHERMDDPRAKDLLAEVLNDGEIVRQPFVPADQMGAPPKGTASHGRANPAGIPYLYLGSTPTTAVSEIRPHTGEIACVAEFSTPPDLKVVDLRRPRKTVSPFLLPDAMDVARMRSDLPFLERLGEELTRPVLPHAAAIDYTPSQYLCEFIKKRGYDGVVYRSSVSDGINLALFSPSRAQVGNVMQTRVTRVSVDVALLSM